jgi:hypothetical protein
MTPPISILSSANGNSILIKQLHHDKPHQTLGVLLSPDKNHNAELKCLTNKAQELAQQTSSTILPHSQAAKAYWTIWLGQIQYGITKCQQCKDRTTTRFKRRPSEHSYHVLDTIGISQPPSCTDQREWVASDYRTCTHCKEQRKP